MTYTREEIITKLTAFENGWEKADAAYPDFWKVVIELVKQEPTDDAISREAALEKMADYVSSGYADSVEDFEQYSKIICQLPSVQPSRKGHWILQENPNPKVYADKYVCSECGADVIGTIEEENFCHRCGASMADMRGDTE